MIKITIIIPVYKVEAYIENCIKSVINQSIDTDKCIIECIIVDDCSPDKSMKIAEEMIANYKGHIQFICIKHDTNQGLSAARNSGIARAKGDYIVFLDSDDMLMDESLGVIVETAAKSKADLILADYITIFEVAPPKIKTEKKQDYSYKIKTGHKLFLEDFSPHECFVWRAVYKRKYLEEINIKFINGISFEDVPFSMETYIKAKKSIRLYYSIYIYRRRHNSLSSAISKKSITDLNQVIEKLWSLKELDGNTPQIKEKVLDDTFAIFSLNLWYISNNKDILKHRQVLIKDLKTRIPDLKFSHGIKQKIVSLLYILAPSTYLKLRSII